jgi:pyruvate kinase
MTSGIGGDAPARATKIVATIGSRAEEPGTLQALLAAGVDVVRLNGAHLKAGQIKRLAALVRRAERKLGRPVGILLDLGGPKIRVGPIEGGTVVWEAGETVEIVPGAVRGAGRRIGVTYPKLLADVGEGAVVKIDDGRVVLRVESKAGRSLSARVLVGGRVKSEAGVNFPSSELSAPALTAKDRRDLAEGLAAGIDFVGLSFVRSAAHVLELKRLLKRVADGRRPWVVAKIERGEALSELEAIARASDILMVARGDLGVEIGLASVPRVQREILAMGRRLAVPVIVATQMLESMIEHPTPTRAEVSDVAGAVHDGADAVMLSGETAIGAHAVEAVRVMAEIALTAEVPDDAAAPLPLPHPAAIGDFPAVVAAIAADAARIGGARALVVYTELGRTARLASKSPLRIPLFVFTPRQEVRRRMTILRDVVSFRIPAARTVEQMIRSGDRVLLRQEGLAGATVVEVSGSARAEGATNAVRIRRLPERRVRGATRKTPPAR